MKQWDAVGYLACSLVLLTFYMKDMFQLRVAALCSNFAFLSYGIALHLFPVAILHAILIPMNAWRLWNLLREREPSIDALVEQTRKSSASNSEPRDGPRVPA